MRHQCPNPLANKKKGGPVSKVTSNTNESPSTGVLTKNPKRVAAGRRNRKKRRGLTPTGRERLRQNAIRHRPWRYATGPKTAAGKAISAKNRVRKSSRHPLLLAIQQLRTLLLDPARELRLSVARTIAGTAAN
jgi:hypothetical protein